MSIALGRYDIIGRTLYDRHKPTDWPTLRCMLPSYGFSPTRGGWQQFIGTHIGHFDFYAERLCRTCGSKAAEGRTVCMACHSYYHRTGKERPARMWNKNLPPMRARWCKVCGSLSVEGRTGKCELCIKYFQRHRRDRPRYLWDVDATCINCGIPLSSQRKRKNGYRRGGCGLCYPCYQYQQKCRRARPRYLWGIGEYGWCLCGCPAVTQHDGFNLCSRCATEAVR
jgi:hypothetical protein